MTALDFTARALGSQALALLRAGTFPSLNGRFVPAEVKRLHTTGHTEAGKGAATYVSDSLCDAALLAAHPACAFRAADGRIFRLLPEAGAIGVEQCGAVGDPARQHIIDDRNAIQAALDYAAAMAIGEIRFDQRHYSLWTPERASPTDAVHAPDGHPLVATASVALRSACGGSHLHFRAHDGSSAEENPQPARSTAAAPVPDAFWRGGGLFVPADAEIEDLVLDHVHLIGGRLRSDDDADPSDHGLWLAGDLPGRLVLDGVVISGFKGDLYHAPAADPAEQMLSNCHFHTCNGTALHSSSASGPFGARDCRFGNARYAARIARAAHHTYSHCRFDESESLAFSGTAPSIRFIGCTIERIPECRFGSWTRGDLAFTDSQLFIGGVDEPHTAHIDLTLTAWLDAAEGLTAVTLNGPPDLTTQVAGAASGTWYAKPSDIAVCVASARRLTAGGDAWARVFAVSGLLDSDTVRLSAGDCEGALYVAADTPADLPLIAPPLRFQPSPGAQPFGGSHSAPAPGTIAVVDPVAIAHTFSPTGAGTNEIALGDAYGHADGQGLTLWHGGTGKGDRILRLSPGNTGLDLSTPLELRQAGDNVELRYDAALDRWRLAGPAFTRPDSAGGEAGGGAGTWARIAEATPRGVSSIEFAGIAQNYADLLMVFEDVSHDNGSNTNLTMAFSSDGLTYSSPAGISSNAAQSVSWHGTLEIVRYAGNSGSMKAGISNLTTSPGHFAASNTFAWRANGGISALRVALSAGQFDAGTIALYAR